MPAKVTLFLAAMLASCAEVPPPPASQPGAGQGPAVRAPVAPVAIDEYFKIRRVGGASFSHDEKLVAYLSDEGGRPDLWVQAIGAGGAAGAGGQAVQITHVSGVVHSYAFSPGGPELVYEADQGGDELPHLYLTDSKGDKTRDLAEGYPKGARTRFVRWADDGRSFLFLSNLRENKYLDLYEYPLATGKPELLWKSSGKLAFALPSRDHRRFILIETLSDVDTNLYLLDRGKDAPALLTPHKGDILYDPQTFSKDGKTLYFTSDQGGEFTALYAMVLGSSGPGQTRLVQRDNWDVEGAGFSRAWKYFYTLTNVDGTRRFKLIDEKTHIEVKLPAAPPGAVFFPRNFSRSDRFLAATLHTDTAPVASYVLDLKEGRAIRLTEVLPDSLRERPMVPGEAVRIPSFDGKEVPALLYRSGRPAEKGQGPAVIDVHGGPTGQSRREFNPMRQYLVSKGYAVLVPNVRGSTGYGKSYTRLDNLDLGGGPLKDVVACKAWLVDHAGVAADRVVVLGGSYGGYMALSAAAFTPTEFAASVDYFGVSDLKSLVESFPPYWATFATAIYQKFGDPRNPAHARYQHDRSPLYFIDRIQRPLLVVQGDHDARVKKDQSDRIVSGLKDHKVPVHYLVIKDEGHGFSRNENRLLAYQVTDRFLDRYIFGDTSVVVGAEAASAQNQAKNQDRGRVDPTEKAW